MVVNIIEGIIYVIAGGVISFVTLWISWEIEKKRKRLFWRKGFVNECKKIINENKFSPDAFRETSYYLNLKANFSDALRKKVEEQRYIPGRVMSLEQRKEVSRKEYAVKKKLLEEINTLEKKWGLL